MKDDKIENNDSMKKMKSANIINNIHNKLNK